MENKLNNEVHEFNLTLSSLTFDLNSEIDLFRADDSETNSDQMILNAWQAILKTINGPESDLTQKKSFWLLVTFAFRLKQSVLVLRGRSHSEFKSTLSDVVDFYPTLFGKEAIVLSHLSSLWSSYSFIPVSIWAKSDIDKLSEQLADSQVHRKFKGQNPAKIQELKAMNFLNNFMNFIEVYFPSVIRVQKISSDHDQFILEFPQ